MYKGTAESRYRYLEPEKSLYLDRAIECSKYTLPTLITDNDRSSGKQVYNKITTTFQGLGARGVNNLAAKLLIALLPPNQAFFRLSVADITLQQELDYFKDFHETLAEMKRLTEDDFWPDDIRNLFGYDNETIFACRINLMN